MIERIILSVVAVAMLFFTLRRRDLKSTLLTAILTVAILLTWTKIAVLITIGFVLYILGGIGCSLYGIFVKKLSNSERFVIVLTGMLVFTSQLFGIMHWMGGNVFGMLKLIPLIGYIILLFKGFQNKKEFGFVTILNVLIILQFVKIWLS